VMDHERDSAIDQPLGEAGRGAIEPVLEYQTRL
jgi:hypothetical protein